MDILQYCRHLLLKGKHRLYATTHNPAVSFSLLSVQCSKNKVKAAKGPCKPKRDFVHSVWTDPQINPAKVSDPYRV